jgi:hypothetical protein
VHIHEREILKAGIKNYQKRTERMISMWHEVARFPAQLNNYD